MSSFRKYRVGINQTPLDIALEQYGAYEGLSILAADNSSIITDFATILEPGTFINVRTEIPKLTESNNAVALEIQRSNVNIATGNPKTPVITFTASFVCDGNGSLIIVGGSSDMLIRITLNTPNNGSFQIFKGSPTFLNGEHFVEVTPVPLPDGVYELVVDQPETGDEYARLTITASCGFLPPPTTAAYAFAKTTGIDIYQPSVGEPRLFVIDLGQSKWDVSDLKATGTMSSDMILTAYIYNADHELLETRVIANPCDPTQTYELNLFSYMGTALMVFVELKIPFTDNAYVIKSTLFGVTGGIYLAGTIIQEGITLDNLTIENGVECYPLSGFRGMMNDVDMVIVDVMANTTSTASNSTIIAFTPSANKRYKVRCYPNVSAYNTIRGYAGMAAVSAVPRAMGECYLETGN